VFRGTKSSQPLRLLISAVRHTSKEVIDLFLFRKP
jgi:hypothetical protein